VIASSCPRRRTIIHTGRLHRVVDVVWMARVPAGSWADATNEC